MASASSGHDPPGASHSQSSNANISPTSYSNAITSTAPKRENAIVIDSIEGLTIDDYLDGLELLLDLTNVMYISKISGSRVCIYLNSKKHVDSLKSKKITIKDKVLSIKPLINSGKRVVISNVQPVIPNYIIIDALKQRGIQILSQISEIRASTSKPGRSHIMSFRRQFYIKEEVESSIPETLQVTFDNTTYWTYLSTDSASCYNCKQTGHISKVCPNSTYNASQANSVNVNNNKFLYENLPSLPQTYTNMNELLNLKRPHSTTTNDTLSLSSDQKIIDDPSEIPQKENLEKMDATDVPKSNAATPTTGTKPRRTKKRQKIYPAVSTSDSLLKEVINPAAHIFEDSSNKNSLTRAQFVEFLNTSFSSPDGFKEALSTSTTSSPSEVIDIINRVYDHVTNSQYKSKLTRLKNKLINGNITETSSKETDEAEDFHTDEY